MMQSVFIATIAGDHMITTPERRRRKHHRIWQTQDQRCIWCGLKTWYREKNKSLKSAANELGLSTEIKDWKKKTRKRMATREHIVQKRLGGTDGAFNIVSACAACNIARESQKITPNPDVLLLLPKKQRSHVVYRCMKNNP